MSTFHNAFSLLQKIGKRMMLPVSVLPVAGILLGIGSANFSWLPQTLSQVMAASGSAIFGNLPLLFAIGVSPSGSRTMTASLRLPAPWAMSSSSDRWVFSRSSLASRRPT